VTVRDVSPIEPSLEDVFISLIGASGEGPDGQEVATRG
jgi:hypothetical protein